MRNIVAILLISVALITASFNHTGIKDYEVRKIVIDAGHGGKDQGTSGEFSVEKDIALNIALETGKVINEYLPDVEIIYTRNDDSFPSLYERADIANNNHADLFISVHCNSAPYSSKVKGTETYIMGLHKSDENFEVAKRENSVITLEEDFENRYENFDPNSPESYILFSLYQNAYLNNSLLLAQKVEDQFKNRVGRRSRGVKSAGFLVLYKTSMPSILIETGFLSNAQEERELNDKLQQTYIASGIYRAFRDYKQEIESQN